MSADELCSVKMEYQMLYMTKVFVQVGYTAMITV